MKTCSDKEFYVKTMLKLLKEEELLMRSCQELLVTVRNSLDELIKLMGESREAHLDFIKKVKSKDGSK